MLNKKYFCYIINIISGILLLGIFVTFAYLSILNSWETEEDAFISFIYAEHLVEGKGLCFNIDERVEGYSNFTWVLLLAILDFLGFSLPAASKWLGVFFSCLTMLLVWFLCCLIYKDHQKTSINKSSVLNSDVIKANLKTYTTEAIFSRLIAFLALIYLATNQYFIYWSCSGLETPFFAFLFILAAWVASHHKMQKSWILPIVFMIIFLSRPEGILYVFAYFMYLFFIGWRYQEKIPWQYIFSLIFIIGLFFLFRWLYFEDFLPNTYWAKLSSYLSIRLAKGFTYLCEFISFQGILICLFPLLSLFFNSLPIRSIILLWLTLICSVVFTIYSGGDLKPSFRFLFLSLPIIAVLIITTCRGFLNKVQYLIKIQLKFISISKVIILLILGILTYSYLKPIQSPGLFIYHILNRPKTFKHCMNLWNNPYHYESVLHMDVARWMVKNIPDGSLISYDQMGKGPYYLWKNKPNVSFIDTYGLIDKKIAHLLYAIGNATNNKQHQEYVEELVSYIKYRSPDFILFINEPVVYG